MKIFNLGKICGENGESVTIKMGKCTLVDTQEEAGAELIREGEQYTLNLKIPKPIGGGDMKMAVYDKEGKCQDLYEFIGQNAVTLKGGIFEGAIVLHDDPTHEKGAATKRYIDKAKKELDDKIASFLKRVNESDAAIDRDMSGDVNLEEKLEIPMKYEKKEGITGDGGEIFVEDIEITDAHKYLRFKAEKICGGHMDLIGAKRDRFYLKTEDGKIIEENTSLECRTPQKFEVIHYSHYAYSTGNDDEYSVQLNKITFNFEKRNLIALEEGEENGDNK